MTALKVCDTPLHQGALMPISANSTWNNSVKAGSLTIPMAMDMMVMPICVAAKKRSGSLSNCCTVRAAAFP